LIKLAIAPILRAGAYRFKEDAAAAMSNEENGPGFLDPESARAPKASEIRGR
jgi:hypothetical protein